MSATPDRAFERRGIISINSVSNSYSPKSEFQYECFICNRKLQTTKSSIAHMESESHVQNANRFNMYIEIIPAINSLDKTSLSCKLCSYGPTWQEAAEHVKTHNVSHWLKPNDLQRTFFRHFISVHNDSIYRCNLCNNLYSNWIHALDHTKHSKHISNWNQKSASTANYALYDNSIGIFQLLISNRIFIGDTRRYHCHSCNLSFDNVTEASNHTEETEHKDLKVHFHKKISEFKSKIPESFEWIKKSSLIVVMEDKIYCKLCDIYILHVREIEPHMKFHNPEYVRMIEKDRSHIEQVDSDSDISITYESPGLNNPLAESQLVVPPNFKWMIAAHKIIVNKWELYCTICDKHLTNNYAIISHLKTHLKPGWKEENAARLLEAGQQGATSKQGSSTPAAAGTSGIAKRNAKSPNSLGQTKVPKVDHLSGLKAPFKNVGNYIQIIPQSSQSDNNLPKSSQSVRNPLSNVQPSGDDTQKIRGFTRFVPIQTNVNHPAVSVTNTRFPRAGLLGHRPPLLKTPSNPKNQPRHPFSTRPNLIDTMSIPSLMDHPVNPPANITNRPLLPTPVDPVPLQKQSVNKQPLLPTPIDPVPLKNQPVNKQPLLFTPTTQDSSQAQVTNSLHKPVNNQPLRPSKLNSQSSDPPLQNLPVNKQPLLSTPNNQISSKTQPVYNNNKQNNYSINSFPVNSHVTNSFDNQSVTQPNRKFNQPLNRVPLKLNSPLLPTNHELLNTTLMTKVHKANYLFFSEDEIYEMFEETKRRIILSTQLSFFVKYTSDYFIYCVVCEKSIPYNLQNVYEHYRSPEHNDYLSKMEEDDQHFSMYPNQFSCLALSKEFLIENQRNELASESDLKEFICCACDVTVQDQDALLRQHLQSEDHQSSTQNYRRHSEELIRDLFPLVECSWYSIEKYSCWPCQKIMSGEMPFAEHLESKKHLSTMRAISFEQRKKYSFDSCTVCGILWFGDQNEYWKHCSKDACHRQWTRSIEDRIDYLPEEARNMCASPEMIIADLVQEADKVINDQGRDSELIRSLELAVTRKFPEAKAHPFGSRITGLGFTTSDIDIFLDCGGTYNGQYSHADDLIDKIHHCLKLDSQAWSIESVIENSRIPIIKVYHSHSQLKCDVSFTNGLSVENTKLLKIYLDAHPRCREMILFIKKWLSICNLTGPRNITSYAISWFVIFYLQTREILPRVASLMQGNPKPLFISGWQVGARAFTVQKMKAEITSKELLKGFFSYYAEFDFRFNLACPLLGTVKSKKDFLNLTLLPDEMKSYVEHVTTETNPELFRIDSPMCIQDPYDLSHNLTKGVRKGTLDRFRKLCRKSAQILSGEK